jgi:hypothetical protein
VPTFDAAAPEGKRIDDNVRRALTEDIIGQYVLRLQNDLGTSINMNAVRQVSSGSVDRNQN